MVGTILIVLILFILFLLVLLTALQLFSMYHTHQMKEISYEAVLPEYWPTQNWQFSEPEQQGVSSNKLLEMVGYYHKYQQQNKEALIDSITIIRNEHIIADLYFNPLFPKSKKHIINSCTKSIMGILIGIAIDKGFIKDIYVPILDFFEDASLKNVDERLKSMTIKDLLTMRTGWNSQDSYLYKWSGLFNMQATENWTDYILNLPFEVHPNSRFDYSNMASFLLSAIITKASNIDTFSFADKYLFSPLGITDILWDKSPKGIYIGFARMWLKPHDMAKIGLLFLQKGKWEDQQIVSKSWVEASIRAHSFPKKYRYIYDERNKKNFGLSGASWIFAQLVRPFSDGYGYQWWLDESGMFAAVGVGGQYIMVVPGKRLIVVATSKLKGKDSFLPVSLLKKFILPAIESDSPIPSDEISYHKLVSYSMPPADLPEIKSVKDLPPIAQQISGKRYALNDSIELNPWQYKTLCLSINADEKYAVFDYSTANNEKIQFEVGLNHQYRTTEFNGKTYAAKGTWINNQTFSMDVEMIGYSSKSKWLLTFNNHEIEVTEAGMTGRYNYDGKLIVNDLRQPASEYSI